ncbi:MAG: hypothetical protein D6732_12980, partial [Methanobacteriota archaeon]
KRSLHMTHKKHHVRSYEHYKFWGIFFILVGIIIFLDSAEFLDFGMIFSRYWPVLLMALGISLLTRKQPNMVGGSILLLFGIYFQLDELGWIYYPYRAYFFSAALIVIGAIFLYHASKKERELEKPEGLNTDNQSPANPVENTSKPPTQP